MDNQDSSTGCIVTHGGFSRALERSSDSSKLRSELPSLLEPPPKPARFHLKKSSRRLIAQREAGEVSTLQQKTEAGIRKAEPPKAPEHAIVACFFVLSYLWWLKRGTFMVAGDFGIGISKSVWAATTESRNSCGSDFNPRGVLA